MTDGVHISRDELALYAMQALAREEAALVQAHVEQCGECRAELALAQGEVALLAMSGGEQALPTGAKQRFMARLQASIPADPPSAPVRARSDGQGRRWSVWIPWAAVAALLGLAGGLELQLRDLRGQFAHQAEIARVQSEVHARAQRVLELLTSQRAQHVVLTAAKPAVPSARAVYLASQGALILQASNLAPVAQDKTYELWIIPADGKAPVPAGLFRPDATGSASLVLPALPMGVPAKAFGVTVEKASGSQAPTLPIVLSGAVPTSGE